MRTLFWEEIREAWRACLPIIVGILIVRVLPKDLSEPASVMAMLFFLPVLCGYLGSRYLASDRAHDRLDHILVLPVSREQLWCARVGADLLLAVVTCLVSVPAFLTAIGTQGSPASAEAPIWTAGLLTAFAVGAFLAPVMRDPTTIAFVAATACMLAAVLHTFIVRRVGLAGCLGPESWAVVAYLAMWSGVIVMGSFDVFRRIELTDRSHCLAVAGRTGAQIAAMMMALIALMIWWVTRR